MRRTLASLALLALAGPLLAQDMPKTIPGAPDVKRVTAGTYKVDSAHTQIEWRVNHMGFSNFSGFFGSATGTLVLDPAKPSAARLSITIPTGAITTVGELNAHLKSADFFDVAKYPTATFTSTAVQVAGTNARITGNLTLHGVTRPVTLNARFIGAGPGMMGAHPLNIGFDASTQLKRGDFGINYGVPIVSDVVGIHINAAFEKQ